MATAQSFFNGDTPHGLIKRVMYKKYLQAFIPVTQTYYSTVIIDGFAGPGRYGPGWPTTIEEYGSPIIALIVAVGHLAKTHRKIEIDLVFGPRLAPEYFHPFRAWNEPKSNAPITLYFVEGCKRNFISLCYNVRCVFVSFSQQIPGSVCLMDNKKGMTTFQFRFPSENCSDLIVLTCIIQNMKFQDFPPPSINTWTARWLTFLDPFGYSHTPMNIIQKYVGEGREVLINFMSSFVHRFVSVNPKVVAELFGINIEEAMEDIIAEFERQIQGSSIEAHQDHPVKAITRNFEEILKRKAGSEFSLIFEMRGKNNAIIYHMVFITNHIMGVEKMKESMNRCTQEKNMLGMSDFKIFRLDHELSLENDQNPADVADSIFQEFQGKTLPLEKVKIFVSLDTPYVFRKKVLKLMEMENISRLIHVQNINPQTTAQLRKHGTFPDWGTWVLQFKDGYINEMESISTHFENTLLF